MSWDVYLQDTTAKPWCSYGVSEQDFEPDWEGDVPCPVPCYPAVAVERHAEGGTYALGGIESAELNITYNYGGLFREAWDGVGLKEALDGKRAEDVIEALSHAVKHLGTEQAAGYWEATAGNAGYSLGILLGWAQQYPDARFRVS